MEDVSRICFSCDLCSGLAHTCTASATHSSTRSLARLLTHSLTLFSTTSLLTFFHPERERKWKKKKKNKKDQERENWFSYSLSHKGPLDNLVGNQPKRKKRIVEVVSLIWENISNLSQGISAYSTHACIVEPITFWAGYTNIHSPTFS